MSSPGFPSTPGAGFPGGFLPGFGPAPTPAPPPPAVPPPFLISSPLTPPPQQFTNVPTLIDGQADIVQVLLFLRQSSTGATAILPNQGLPGRGLPGFGIANLQHGVLLNEGADYKRVGGRVTLTVAPAPGETITVVVFARGVALGGPKPRRFIAPWQLPLPLDGSYDGVSTDYQIHFGPTIFGKLDGINRSFSFGVNLRRASVYRNGLLQTLNVDVMTGPTSVLFTPVSIPQPGDVITILGWP